MAYKETLKRNYAQQIEETQTPKKYFDITVLSKEQTKTLMGAYNLLYTRL